MGCPGCGLGLSQMGLTCHCDNLYICVMCERSYRQCPIHKPALQVKPKAIALHQLGKVVWFEQKEDNGRKKRIQGELRKAEEGCVIL